MSLSHLLESRLAFSTLLNQEGGIFSAFYNSTRVLQRSLAPEIGGKKGSWFPNIHTTSQSSPMQAYNQSINYLDKELDHLKSGFEVLRMEGMLVDEYGRCEDPIREMEGMLVDEYGSNASTIQLAGLLSSHIYDFSNNVSPADPNRTLVDSETSTVTPSGLMSYFCGEPDALAYGKITMSLSHLLESRLAFSTLLNQEGGIFSAYKATRVLQRSLAPEIGGKKGSWFPNVGPKGGSNQ